LEKAHFTLKEHCSPSFFFSKNIFQNNEKYATKLVGKYLWTFGIPSFVGIDTSWGCLWRQPKIFCSKRRNWFIESWFWLCFFCAPLFELMLLCVEWIVKSKLVCDQKMAMFIKA
jgi:hypothetical protein